MTSPRWVLLGIGSVLLVTGACRRDVSAEVQRLEGAESGASLVDRPEALEPTLLEEGLRALRPYIARGSTVLDVRARAGRLIVQARMADTSTVAEYVYDGRVLGPSPTHLSGSGELEDNLFDLDDVDWKALTALFPSARSHVDPTDGLVTELIVRRFLPVSSDIRARLYVSSPRMSGHLDADSRGRALTGD